MLYKADHLDVTIVSQSHSTTNWLLFGHYSVMAAEMRSSHMCWSEKQYPKLSHDLSKSQNLPMTNIHEF